MKQKLLDAIDGAMSSGAEYISYGGIGDTVKIDNAIEYIQRLPDDLGDAAEDLTRWYECDASGNRIIRAKEIYGGITTRGSGVIVLNGSAEVFCGNWVGAKGLPQVFGSFDETGTSRMFVAVCLSWKDLDEDTLELAFNAANAKGDKSPTISEVFRVNDMATIITFDGWD
jgi:hypothetical protein